MSGKGRVLRCQIDSSSVSASSSGYSLTAVVFSQSERMALPWCCDGTDSCFQQDVPEEEEEEEEAGDLHSQELRAQGAHVLRPDAGLFRGSAASMAKPHRHAPETQTCGGSLQRHAGAAQTTEGNAM